MGWLIAFVCLTLMLLAHYGFGAVVLGWCFIVYGFCGGAIAHDGASRNRSAPPARPAPPTVSCWDVLGLQDTATEDEIKSAHRRLAMKVHPDQGGTKDLIRRVNRARDIALRQRGAT